MKLFTTIILFYFAFSSQILFAQERQYNPTIEETVGWLNNFGFPNKKEGNSLEIFYIDKGNYVKFCKETTGCDRELRSKYPEYFACASGKGVDYLYRYTKNTDLTEILISKDTEHITISLHDKLPMDITYKYSLGSKKLVNRTVKALKHLFKLLKTDVKIKNNLELENKF